jgi:hypothetical protein
MCDRFQQIAIRRVHIPPHQNGLACLVDFILRADLDGREILPGVHLPGPVHGVLQQVMKNRRPIARYSVEPQGFLSYPRALVVDLISGSEGILILHQFTHPFCYSELNQANSPVPKRALTTVQKRA